jgi:hypothetical protein
LKKEAKTFACLWCARSAQPIEIKVFWYFFFKKEPLYVRPGAAASPSLWGAMPRGAASLAFAAVLFAGSAAMANPVPSKTQRLLEAFFAPQLPLPDTAIWRFELIKPYMGGGDIVCGAVNFQRSTRVYIGFLGFYAVVRHGKVGINGLQAEHAQQDPTGAFKFAYETLCH